MIRMVSFRSVCATTSTLPRVDAPIVTKRASSKERVSPGNVVDSGSSSTVVASWKLTRCFLRFALAFAGSHSNCTLRVYAPDGDPPSAAQRSPRLGGEAGGPRYIEGEPPGAAWLCSS